MTKEIEDVFKYLAMHVDGIEGAVIRTDGGWEWLVTWEKGRCYVTQTK